MTHGAEAQGHDGHDHGNHAHDHHAHDHGAMGHVHAPANFGQAFAIGIGLNAAFVLIEAGFGVAAHSIALFADAGHNLSDVLALVLAWVATRLVRRAPTPRYTYGMRRSSILAALANAILLLVVTGAIAWEAVLRLVSPEPVNGIAVLLVAAAGIAVNGITAWLFSAGRAGDLNIRGAYLHMLGDAAVAAGVVVMGLLIRLTGALWLDPVASLVIGAVIVWTTWSMLRESTALSLDAVPAGIDPDAVGAFLAAQPRVAGLHDLHIWAMSTEETALTAHLVMLDGHPGDAFLGDVCRSLQSRFRIGHATLQIETDLDNSCTLKSSPV